MSSVFTHNEACPKCRDRGEDLAGDNLACYSDKHKYCFKCGHYVPGDALTQFTTVATPERKVGDIQTCDFSAETLAYLKSYGLTNDEIHQHLQGHADGYCFIDSKFQFIRRLHKKPKVLTYGDVVGNEPIFATDAECHTIVIVEDVVSAIKVSRLFDSCALLKANIHGTLLSRLSRRYDSCVLWLDPDMHKHMAEVLLPKVQPYFVSTQIIMSSKDPKEHTIKEIGEYLYGY